jgi:cytochrome d ubiquinol oxidase subunit II
MVGAIASERVPTGNAAGAMLGSWLNPTSALVGVLAVAVCAYLAACYLAADAARHRDAELVAQFRVRALLAGTVAGAIALAGLVVLHSDAHRIYTRLLEGPGLPGLVVSLLAGVATLALVAARRFELARVSAALAVAGTIAGWALAQQPRLLAHLTIAQAAAPRETLIALLAAIGVGAAILFPSLGLLFGLFLRGGFDEGGEPSPAAAVASPRALLSASSAGLHARLSLAGLVGGLGLLTAAEAPWAHAVGVVCLFGCMIFAFLAVDPTELAAAGDRTEDASEPR